MALSAIAPSPRTFAAAAVIAIPIAALLAGVTEFLILDGLDQFPLLAIGMAPSVLAAALLFTIPTRTPRSASFYSSSSLCCFRRRTRKTTIPKPICTLSFLAITAVILLFAVLWTILPASDDLRRRWYLKSARAELRDLLAGRRPGTEMTTPCSGTPTASGNWPRCSLPMAMSVVTIFVRPLTSSVSLPRHDVSRQRSPTVRPNGRAFA